MTNERSLDDLLLYTKWMLYAFGLLSLVITLSILVAAHLSVPWLIDLLGGLLLGTILSTLNMLALGYCFYVLVLKRGSRLALLWPCLSFMAMCVAGFYFAARHFFLTFGFALGAASPLLIGAMVIFALGRVSDRGKPA